MANILESEACRHIVEGLTPDQQSDVMLRLERLGEIVPLLRKIDHDNTIFRINPETGRPERMEGKVFIGKAMSLIFIDGDNGPIQDALIKGASCLYPPRRNATKTHSLVNTN